MYYFSILYSFYPFISPGGPKFVMFHLMKRYWNPHWIRVAEQDEAMKIGPWVATKRKAFWEARFAVAVANCNASMISRSQHITD